MPDTNHNQLSLAPAKTWWVALLAISVLTAAIIIARPLRAVAVACPTDPGIAIGGLGGYLAPRDGGRTHAGIDIGVSFRPIYAAEGGNVEDHWYDGYQNTKDLHANSGRVYRYAHLSQGGVSGGVSAGQNIGQSGDGDGTFRESGPHLHWEIRTDGGGFSGQDGSNGTIDPTPEYQNCGGGSSAPPPTVDCHSQTIQYGDRGDCVVHAQQHLNSFGYGLGEDGIFGQQTDGAVRDFQSKHGLGVDGVIGPNTWNALHSSNQPAPAPSPSPTPAPATSSPSAPSVSATCNGSTPTANISWSQPSFGVNGYTVDVDNDNWAGAWWNKNTNSTSLTAPDGFRWYDPSNPSANGQTLTFNGGSTYYVRVYYQGPGIHSQTATFQASNCSTASPPSSPSPSTSSLSAPSASPVCSGNTSKANISWSEAGRGSSGYYVDLTTDSNFNWINNKKANAGTTSTVAPDGFSPYNGSAQISTLNSGTTYFVRIFYIASGEHSPGTRFVANSCSSAPPPSPSPSPASPPPSSGPNSLASPTVSTLCSNRLSKAVVSWAEAGRGRSGYYVDLSADPSFNTINNKKVNAGTTTTLAPDGFGSYNGSTQIKFLRTGFAYFIRIYYISTGEHSPGTSFVAPACIR